LCQGTTLAICPQGAKATKGSEVVPNQVENNPALAVYDEIGLVKHTPA